MGLNQTKTFFASYTPSLHQFTVVWLDNYSSTNGNYQTAQNRIRSNSNVQNLKLFENPKECNKFLKHSSDEQRFILIINEHFVPDILLKMSSLRQVSSIYIRLTRSKEKNAWQKHCSKVKFADEDLNKLIDKIHSFLIKHRTRVDEPLNISLIHPSDFQGKSTTYLDGNFLHSQVSLDVLLRMKPSSTEKQELINVCRKEYLGNDEELTIIDEFQRDYSSNRALWWYTRESFLYRLLNKALRTQNMDMLFHFRFFIRDIEQQLEIHRYSSSIRLYRCQHISHDELNLLKNSIGKFISVNSFLSTSIDRNEALSFLAEENLNEHLQNVLFEIDADARIKGVKPFANITEQSFYPEEEEVLFMCGSIFELIRFSEKNHLFIFQLRLTGEKDNNLQTTCEHMKNEYGQNTEQTDLLSFGRALVKMGRYDEAEKYFRRLSNELSSSDAGLADCFQGLGEIEMQRGNYQSSLEHHEKSLSIRRKLLRSNHPDLAESYNSLGIVQRKRGDRQSALDNFEKALRIFKDAFGRHHTKVAMCLNNRANLYFAEDKYSLALEDYLEALAIQEKDLPSDHSDLGTMHCNIGSAYQCLNNSNAALEHFQLSLKILEKTLPSEHPAIATILKNIGIIYENRDEFDEAQRYFERSAIIRRLALPYRHPDRIQIENDLQRVRSLID